MKKRRRVAVFSTGWGGEFVQEALSGIIDLAYEKNIDIFSFINFSIRSDVASVNNCEDNIYRLADIKEFDGVFLFANTFNQDWEQQYLVEETRKYNIPCMSLEYPIAGMPYIASDNYFGMHELMEHMIIVHNCKEFLYISGPENHSEAADRLNAFKDALTENDITFTDDNIGFGDWSKAFIPKIIEGWLEKHNNKYPEAIVCANDIMAIAVCNYLKEHNISIPDDVKVTGYDRIRLAQTASPSIASVNHEWRTMGLKAMEGLLTLMDGGKIRRNIKLKNRFISGGSCGCCIDLSNTDLYQKAAKAMTNNIMDPIDLDSHFRHFYVSIRKADTVEKTHASMAPMFENEHILEGNEFKLCLMSNFFDVKENDDNLTDIGYTDEMNVLCELRGGKSSEFKRIAVRECVFESSERCDNAGYYIFLPLYVEGKSYGFSMLSGPINAANENQYYIWSRHMIVALEQIRINFRMALLWDALYHQSETDRLTGVYNRHGCEEHIYAEMIKAGNAEKKSLIFLIDVDNMKIVNDRLGHAYGDKALVLVVDSINEVLPEGLSVGRYGGDEFIIGGVNPDSAYNPDKIIQSIEQQLKMNVEASDLTLPLTVSCGYAECCPKNIADIEKAVVVADENMYITKENHHKSLLKK